MMIEVGSHRKRGMMPHLGFQPKMVGREDELSELQTYLDKAAAGQGRTVFVSGEAGIGKTRLVNELKQLAQSQGFQILSGNSMYESLTPFMPFIEALRSAGLESLFAEETPRVEAVFLVTHTGLLIKEITRRETKLNPDIFSSMLTTVSNFVKESLSILLGEDKDGALNTLGYENYRILLESGRSASLVVIMSGRENEFLINDMREIFLRVDKKYGGMLEDWDGDGEKIDSIEKLLEPLITSGKYDGIYYGKEDPKARRNLLFENVSMGLARLAQKAPALLCIEDLQWADPSSLALAHYIARNTREHGLLILGTYRPEDVTANEGNGHLLIETMQLMDREGLNERMKLKRLPEECMVDFLSSLLGKIDLDEEFTNSIYKETEGNPLFMIELVKFLEEEDYFENREGVWILAKNLEDVKIPSKIYNVIKRRLNRLGSEDREILDYASVIGENFTSTILVEALGVERIQLLEQLRVLEQTHRLIQPSNGSYRFDHAKIKEVAYGEIPEELRREYHSVVANSIETLNKGNMDKVIGDLAFHYFRCPDRRRALPYFLKAAERAKDRFANAEAIRFYGEALKLEEDVEGRLASFEALGSVYRLMGDYERGLESYRSALELAQEKKKRAEILARIGGVHYSGGDYDESMSSFTEALGYAEEEGSMEEALALRGIGNVHLARGDYDRALEYYERSLVMSEKMGDEKGIGGTLNCIGVVHSSRGDCDRALEYYERSLAMSEKIGDRAGIMTTLNNIGVVHHTRGDCDRALEYYERSLAIKEKIGDQERIAATLNNIGEVHRVRGDYDRALEYFERSLAIRENIGDQAGIGGTLSNIGVVHHNRGEDDRALKYYGRAVVISERIGNQEYLGEHLHNIGIVHKERGDYDQALGYFRKGLSIWEKLEVQWEICNTYCEIAEVHLEKRELEKAQEFCNLAASISAEVHNRKLSAMSGRISGMVYRECETWKEATNNFEESIKAFEDMGEKLGEAESHYEFGLMWKAKGDADKAKEHLNKALKVFEELKLERNAERAREAYKSLPTVRHVNARGKGG